MYPVFESYIFSLRSAFWTPTNSLKSTEHGERIIPVTFRALEFCLLRQVRLSIRSTIEGGRGCNKCVPVLRGNGTKIAPTGYIFDQPPGGMSWVRGKLAGHVGGHVVLSPEEGVLVTSPGTESSYPRPSQLLNNSVVPFRVRPLIIHGYR